LALGGLAQASARRLGHDQRLDEHRHGGIGGIEPVVLHVAARVGGPQRRPAGAHGGQHIGFIVETEEALELAGEVGAGPVLDQSGRAHDAERAVLTLRAPGGEQRFENLRHDGLLVELQANLDREAPRLRRRCRAEPTEQRFELKLCALPPVGVGGEAESARRRQAGARERREVRGLGADAVGIDGGGRAERDDEFLHQRPTSDASPAIGRDEGLLVTSHGRHSRAVDRPR
jgi:hypothetical protein